MKQAFILLATIILIGTCGGCSGFKTWTKKVMEPETAYDEVHENHVPLVNQRLIPRKGHKGHLTNKVCLKFYGAECEKESLKKYDLKEEKVREKLNAFKFACRVGGKRYRICKDRPGLCRSERYCADYGRRWIVGSVYCKRYEAKKSFIHAVDDYKFMLDGFTECRKGM